LTVFNQQLYSLLDAGQPIADAIDILGHNDRRGRNRVVYDTLLQDVRQGKQLSEAMANLPSVFSPLYVAMVKSSETTGTVKAAVRRFMQYQRQVDELRAKLMAAAIYPAILVGVGYLVISFLMLYVVPRFSAVFDDIATQQNAAPGFMQLWGGFVRREPFLAWSSCLLVVVVIAILSLHLGLRQRVLSWVVTLPFVGEKVWLLQLARLYRTIGMLLSSGVSILSAMRMTMQALPVSMRSDLGKAMQAVSEGQPLSAAFAKHHLSTDVAQRLLIAGESSGNLDEMMERIADFYDQEMTTWLDTAGRLVEPILMIGIGLVIGAVVLMLYAPIFDLANAV
jgi:general secretion pathway protein F